MDGDADRSHDWLTGNRNHGLPESSRSRRRRRPPGNVHAFTPAASRPPAMDDDADFYAAAGHPPIERLEQGTNSFDLLPPRRPPPPSLPLRVPDYLRDRFPGRQITSPHYLALDYELSRRRPSATRSQASSSTATPSDSHPGAERTGSRTRIRQSALYADRPRHSRHRRSARNLEHSSDVSSSELEVTNPPTFEALSVRDSTTFPSGTEEHPREVSSSELGGAVTDLPTLEPLSLMSELPLLSPDETSEQSDDEDVYV